MSYNALSTVLNNAGGKALIEEYLDKRFLERRDWDGVLANSMYLDTRAIPQNEGQYVKWTRKGFGRRPQTMDRTTAANEYADPLSGVVLGTEVVQVPMDYIQEWSGVSKVANITSWIDLDGWIREELPLSLKRRMHELVQNAFMVGRYKPGVYDASGNVTTAFDTTPQAALTLDGVSFTFQSAPHYYAGATAFDEIDQSTPTITWADVRRVALKIKLAGGKDVVMWASSSVIDELMHDGNDGEFFAYAIRNSDAAKSALRDNRVTKYAGITIIEDDQPFCEDFGEENVRADTGPIHSCLFSSTSPKAVGYVPLGKKSSWKPEFKVQDITKTGVLKTIGYTIPHQVAVINPAWCAVLKTRVREFTPNNS